MDVVDVVSAVDPSPWLKYGELGVLALVVILGGLGLYLLACRFLDMHKKRNEWEMQSRNTLQEAITRLTESIEKIAVATERSTAAVYMLADIVGRLPDVSEDDVNLVKEISHPTGKTKIMRRKSEIVPE